MKTNLQTIIALWKGSIKSKKYIFDPKLVFLVLNLTLDSLGGLTFMPKWQSLHVCPTLLSLQVLLTFFSILAFFAVLLVAFAFSFFILLHKVANQILVKGDLKYRMSNFHENYSHEGSKK